MRFASFVLITMSVFVDAKLRRFNHGRDLSPKDAGIYHTEAFEKLGKIFKKRMPKNDIELILDVSEVLSTYKPANDDTYNPYKTALESIHAIRNTNPKINFPNNFDKNLQNSIENSLLHVNKVSEDNVDAIVNQLATIHDDLDDMDFYGNNQVYKTIATAGVSIAIESTKLWHAAAYDSDHDFHEIVTKTAHRKLQTATPNPEVYPTTLPTFWVGGIIAADIVGFVEGALLSINSNATLLFLPIDLVGKALYRSISFSAGAALDASPPETNSTR